MSAVLIRKSFGNVGNDIVVEQRSIDWFLLGYEEGSTNRIKLISKGDQGLPALKNHLTEDMVGFGYMKVYDEKQEFPLMNPDFIHITFIGKRVKAQERARAAIHRLDVQQAFPNFIIEFEANCLEDLQMDRIKAQIKEMKDLLED